MKVRELFKTLIVMGIKWSVTNSFMSTVLPQTQIVALVFFTLQKIFTPVTKQGRYLLVEDLHAVYNLWCKW